MGARTYTQKEWRLLSWWLAQHHPDAVISMNVRVGPPVPVIPGAIANPVSQNLTRVNNRWIDAIYLENSTVHLIEAKLNPDPGIFSQLIHYLRCFLVDGQFAHLRDLPKVLIALVNRDDPSVAEEAPFYGVNWQVYQPNLQELSPASRSLLPATGVDVPLPHDWPARLNAWGVKALRNSV